MIKLNSREFIATSEADLKNIAGEIIRFCDKNRIIALYGAMGAGKTTLVRYLCSELGVADMVQSPTFSIVNEYHDINNVNFFHFDFYRIGKTEEVFDIGYEDYFYSGSWCFIEWPEKIEHLLPEHTIKIFIEGNTSRSIKMVLTDN